MTPAELLKLAEQHPEVPRICRPKAEVAALCRDWQAMKDALDEIVAHPDGQTYRMANDALSGLALVDTGSEERDRIVSQLASTRRTLIGRPPVTGTPAPKESDDAK